MSSWLPSDEAMEPVRQRLDEMIQQLIESPAFESLQQILASSVDRIANVQPDRAVAVAMLSNVILDALAIALSDPDLPPGVGVHMAQALASLLGESTS